MHKVIFKDGLYLIVNKNTGFHKGGQWLSRKQAEEEASRITHKEKEHARKLTEARRAKKEQSNIL